MSSRETLADSRETYEQELADIVRVSPEGILVVDEEGTVVFANAAADRLLGRTVEGAVGYRLGYPASTTEPVEVTLRTPDGTVTAQMRATETVWRGDPGFVINLHDITARKRAEGRLEGARNELERLNRILRAIQRVNHAIVRERTERGAIGSIIQKTCDILVASDEFSAAWIALTRDAGEPDDASQTGVDPTTFSELVDDLVEDRLPPCCRPLSDDLPIVHSQIASDCGECPVCRMSGSEEALTTALEHDGHVYGFLTVALPALELDPDEANRLVRVIGDDLAFGLFSLRVERERARMERMLTETERIARVGGWRWDLATDRFTLSDEYMRIHGVQRRAMDREELLTLAAEEERDRLVEALERARVEGVPYRIEHWIEKADTGERRYVRAEGDIPGRDGGRMFGATMDITEARAANARIAFQARMLDAVGEAVIVTDPDGTIRFWNDAAADLYGWSADEVMGRSILEVTPSPEMEAAAGEIMETLGRGERWSGEFTVQKRDGSTFPALVSDTPVFDDRGELEAIIGISTDLSALKAKEDQLREAALQLNAAVRAGGVGLFDWDLETDRVTYSAEWKRQIGYDEDEIGEDISEWETRVHPEDLGPTRERIEEYLASDDPHYEVEFRFRHREGHYLNILTRGAAIRDEEGRPVRLVGSHVDITPLREAEAQQRETEQKLARAQRLESIGRLAGGVAHDFNNALGVILGVADLALQQLGPDDAWHTDFQEIADAARQGAGLTRQLLAFARRQAVAPRPVDLNDAVENMLRMLRRLIGEDIELVWKPADQLPAVHMDPVQVEQILVNLVVNARDAIHSSGTVTIRTRICVVEDHADGLATGVRPGAFVCLIVSDDGVGMDPDTVDQVFEPFFTTKPAGEGTGLGLATILGIVEQNDGFVEVESRPGEGSTFHVHFPAVAGPRSSTTDDESSGALRGGNETILVVEDEVALLRLIQRYLEKLGYTAIGATHADRALELAEKHSEIALLMSDVVMPEMNGRELYEALAEDRPGLRCLFMSGYTSDIISQRGIMPGQVSFIEKPFTVDELAVKLREILDHRPASGPLA
jgi:PAS domain S-box-containing protein